MTFDDFKRNAKIGLVVILAIIVLIVVFQNRATVETRFLFARVEMPRAVLLAVTFGLGVLLGWLLPRLKKITISTVADDKTAD